MEKDTLCISIEDYNELRDFKNKIEAGFTYRFHGWGWGVSATYISTADAIADMAHKLEEIREENENLRHPDKKQPGMEQIKAMNIFEFLKWKRK